MQTVCTSRLEGVESVEDKERGVRDDARGYSTMPHLVGREGGKKAFSLAA
jgi:hypothetical protein